MPALTATRERPGSRTLGRRARVPGLRLSPVAVALALMLVGGVGSALGTLVALH